MIDLSPGLFVIITFVFLLVFLFMGFPLGFVLAGEAFLLGYLVWGERVFIIMYSHAFGFLMNYTFIAVPLFVFMGAMIERSGLGKMVFDTLEIWLYRLKGHIAIVVVLTGTILAACMGVISASIVMMGMVAMPHMMSRGYNKELASGAICAGGTLGILIPPSIMLVIYGPMAELSVGKLFAAAMMPGLLLSVLYVTYIAIRCMIQPGLAPSAYDEEEAKVRLGVKLRLLFSSVVPVAVLVLCVLGSIFLGIAAPTEAAAVGAFAAVVLASVRRKLTWSVLKEVVMATGRITGIVAMIGIGSLCFTGVFLGLGGGEVVADFILAAGGKWGVLAIIMAIVFILGMFIDWICIVFIVVPLVTPIAGMLGFDPLWFAILICINLQMGFLSPPFATAIYWLRGTLPEEYGVNTGHIIRGVFPFIGLIAIGLTLCILFPQIILWLPSVMIK